MLRRFRRDREFMITLEKRGVACTLDPELGGSLLSLSVEGVDLLRPAPVEPRDVLEAACFPLVPFANRIAHGIVRMNGREVVLPPDPAAPPHAHHGHGWRRPWRLVQRTDSVAELELRHSPDAWPWAYVAAQRIALVDRGAVIDLSVTNISGENMPAGLGLHPYFVRREADTIETGARRMVVNSSDGIPVDEAPMDPGEKRVAALDGLDTLLLDDSGRVRLRLGGVRCDLEASGAVGFHVYVPEHENFFCVEPVSHRPNAFFSNAEQHAIAPGETRRLSMQLTTTATPKTA
jgi:aldose 1-epimerase